MKWSRCFGCGSVASREGSVASREAKELVGWPIATESGEGSRQRHRARSRSAGVGHQSLPVAPSPNALGRLGRVDTANLFQLGFETVAEWTFRSQLVQERFGLQKDFGSDARDFEQFAKTTLNFGLGQQNGLLMHYRGNGGKSAGAEPRAAGEVGMRTGQFRRLSPSFDSIVGTRACKTNFWRSLSRVLESEPGSHPQAA